jgi:hypothetical protein
MGVLTLMAILMNEYRLPTEPVSGLRGLEGRLRYGSRGPRVARRHASGASLGAEDPLFWDHILETFRDRVERVPPHETQLQRTRRGGMGYAFVAFHYPGPEYRDELLFRMHQMAEMMATVPGVVDAGQWAEERSDCIVGISMCHGPRPHPHHRRGGRPRRCARHSSRGRRLGVRTSRAVVDRRCSAVTDERERS